MDTVDKANLREFLRSFYGPAVDHWQMNDGVFDVLVRMLQASGRCSDLVDLVPRPMKPGQTAAKWLSREIRSQLLRNIHKRREYYRVCLERAVINLRTDFELAGRGLAY